MTDVLRPLTIDLDLKQLRRYQKDDFSNNCIAEIRAYWVELLSSAEPLILASSGTNILASSSNQEPEEFVHYLKQV